IAQPPHPVVEVKEPRLLRHANLPRCSSTAIESANHSGGEVSRGPQLLVEGASFCFLNPQCPKAHFDFQDRHLSLIDYRARASGADGGDRTRTP
ncbi:MAG: hypothetical protein AAGC57_00545, partial [Pseudomonadota bacterium]